VEDELLRDIARLLSARNAIDQEIAQVIKRPMTSGISASGSRRRYSISSWSHQPSRPDGRFRSGPLTGQAVNIKWYLKREGLLDSSESPMLDHYLVLAGPPSSAISSKGTVRPWCIEAVFLFDARQLRAEQIARGVRAGVASSVIKQQWAAAEIYPSARNAILPITPRQKEQLKIFSP
jgi:hypothetical protein